MYMWPFSEKLIFYIFQHCILLFWDFKWMPQSSTEPINIQHAIFCLRFLGLVSIYYVVLVYADLRHLLHYQAKPELDKQIFEW